MRRIVLLSTLVFLVMPIGCIDSTNRETPVPTPTATPTSAPEITSTAVTTATPTPSPTARRTATARPTPTLASSPTGTPTPSTGRLVASQAPIYRAVFRWLLDQGAVDDLPDLWFVHTQVSPTIFLYEDVEEPDSGVPEIESSGPPLFGDELTEASREEIRALLADQDVRFVDDVQEAYEEGAGNGHCTLVKDDGYLVALAAPRAFTDGGTDSYLAAAIVTNGCEFGVVLLAVALDGADHSVTRVVRQGGGGA